MPRLEVPRLPTPLSRWRSTPRTRTAPSTRTTCRRPPHSRPSKTSASLSPRPRRRRPSHRTPSRVCCPRRSVVVWRSTTPASTAQHGSPDKAAVAAAPTAHPAYPSPQDAPTRPRAPPRPPGGLSSGGAVLCCRPQPALQLRVCHLRPQAQMHDRLLSLSTAASRDASEVTGQHVGLQPRLGAYGCNRG